MVPAAPPAAISRAAGLLSALVLLGILARLALCGWVGPGLLQRFRPLLEVRHLLLEAPHLPLHLLDVLLSNLEVLLKDHLKTGQERGIGVSLGLRLGI